MILVVLAILESNKIQECKRRTFSFFSLSQCRPSDYHGYNIHTIQRLLEYFSSILAKAVWFVLPSQTNTYIALNVFREVSRLNLTK